MKRIIMNPDWAGRTIALCFAIFVLTPIVFAQQKLPVINATSKKVDVQDGAIFRKGIWNLSPEVKPDIYYVTSLEKESNVTFYTNIDSISFKVKPGLSYDFIILLNGKDSCYTQILAPAAAERNYIQPEKIAFDLLKKDFMVFRDSLQDLHPGLYRYKGKKEMNHLFDSCFATLNHDMTELQYFKMLSFLISAIEDGHTSCILPRGIINYFIDSVAVFPFQPRFIGERAYIPCDTKELPAGTEIIAINSQPVSKIKEQLFQYLPSDGRNQSGKNVKINDGHDPFGYMYYLVFGEQPAFAVEYKTANGTHATKMLQAIALKDVKCASNLSRPAKLIQLEYKPGNIALLSIGTFLNDRVSTEKEDFRSILQSAFTEINNKKIKKLVIDIRNNGGGEDELGALLYSYLTDKPFGYFASIVSTKRVFTVSDHPGLARQKPAGNNFKGAVYFLINGSCFSTTADFCAIAKSNSRGQFIGEETGGAYFGNTSGARASITLPNSKIRINIPLHMYVNAVKRTKYSDRGIIPDYTIMPSITDLIQGRDVQMKYALELAEKNY